jgi:hypothetical protein
MKPKAAVTPIAGFVFRPDVPELKINDATADLYMRMEGQSWRCDWNEMLLRTANRERDGVELGLLKMR